MNKQVLIPGKLYTLNEKTLAYVKNDNTKAYDIFDLKFLDNGEQIMFLGKEKIKYFSKKPSIQDQDRPVKEGTVLAFISKGNTYLLLEGMENFLNLIS